MSYRIWWRLGGGRTGRPQSRTFRTYRDAIAFKHAVEAAGHHWPDPDTNPVSASAAGPSLRPSTRFRDHAETFVASRSGIEERTRHDYQRGLHNHILPTFGDLDITSSSLDRTLVREWVNALHHGTPLPHDPPGYMRRPLAAATIHNLHGLLHAILQDTLETDPPLRRTNPATRTRLPSPDDEDDKACYLTPDEFTLIRSSAASDIRDVLTVLAGTGLRYSEMAALQVRDITFAPVPVLYVRRAWRRQADNTFQLGPPKTRAGRRTVILPVRVVEAIKAHLPGKDAHAFVFTAPGGHWWRHSTFYHGRWRPAVEKARRLGLTKNPRIHDLRHTHVAWLLEAGIDLPAIARRLGHKNITTTANTYAHITPTLEQYIATALHHLSNNDTQI